MSSRTLDPDLDRNPPNNISVLISGSGVGGLTSALQLWRIGCDVRICERASKNLTTGDSFTIGHSAIRAIKEWPWMAQQNEAIRQNMLVAFHDQTGERKMGPIEMEDLVAGSAEKNVERYSRPKFHAMLLEQLERVGLRVEYGKEAVDYFEDVDEGKAGIVFRDGSRESADGGRCGWGEDEVLVCCGGWSTGAGEE